MRNFVRYPEPREEERIFMFLDLKSSTAIAETLGHRSYFEFVRDFIADVTAPILHHHGEIYQYVGDEIVVSWDTKEGVTDDACVKCFFDIKDEMELQSFKYLTWYGIVPEFKAGLHLGKVTVGHVGTVKKDRLFSGDAINTTAHIRSKCNQYHTELLISAALTDRLNLINYGVESLGQVQLKGKQALLELNAVFRRRESSLVSQNQRQAS